MNRSKRLVSLILVAVTLITGIVGYRLYKEDGIASAAQVFDTSECVTFQQFNSTHTIPQAVIFIGTHLIYLDSATDELWEIAQESQIVSNQMEVYYKSEFTGGTWYDITDASSINEINGTEGMPIPETDLNDLYVKYYTFTDKQTRLAINDARHCIFDGEYPYYDLYHLDELGNLKLQYDTLISRNNDKSRMDKYYIGALKNFYDRDLRNAYTNDLDTKLYGLQDVYDSLNAAGRDEDAEVIYKLMAKLDHSRRAEIFRQLTEDEDNPIMGNLLDAANGISSDSEDDDDDDDDEDFIANYDVINAISDDTGEVQASYLSHLSKGLSEDPTDRAIDELITITSYSIMEEAPRGLSSAMDGYVRKLGYLFNIDEGVVKKRDEERAVVENELLPQVSAKFTAAVKQGVSENYRNALNQANITDAALTNILENDESDIDIVRAELQEVITALKDRLDIDQAILTTLNRIEYTTSLLGSVPSSDFADYEINQINEHIAWLQDLLAELYALAGMGDEEGGLNNLLAQADDLLVQQQKALDDNDLAKARELGAERDALLNKIDDLTASLNNILDDPNASASDRAMAQAQLAGSDLSSSLAKALEALDNGDGTGGGTGGGTGDGTGGGTGGGTGDGTGDGTGGGTGDGTGDGTDGNGSVSEDDLLSMLADLLGDLNSLSAADLGKAIKAMELIYRNDDILAAGNIAKRLANMAVAKNNKYVYALIKNTSIRNASQGSNNGKLEYVYSIALAKASNYRFTYSTTKQTATLVDVAGGSGKIYEFVVGRNTIRKRDGSEDTIGGEVQLQGYPYIPVDAASTYMDCVACDITLSSYGVVLTNTLDAQAVELYNTLISMIKGE